MTTLPPLTRIAPPAVTLAAGLLLFLTGCAPRLAPLYRDFEVQPHDDAVRGRIETALETAGWATTPSSAPNAVATEQRMLRNWGLYKVVVQVEVVPIGDEYVRLYVHPYRHYITGNRSKIPFLKGSLRAQLLPALNEAFDAEGFTPVGTPFDREEDPSADETE